MESYAFNPKYAIICLITVISLLQPSYGRPIPGVPMEEPTRDVLRKTDDDYGWGVIPQEPKPMEADVYTSPGVTPQEQLTTPIADVYASWGVTPQKDLKPTEAVVSTTNIGFEAFDALLGSKNRDEDGDEEPYDDYDDSGPVHFRARSLGEDENERNRSPGGDTDDPKNRLRGMVRSLGEDENERNISPGEADELQKRLRGMINALVGDKNERKTSRRGGTDGPKSPLGRLLGFLIKEKNAQSISSGRKTDDITRYMKELRSIEASTDNEHLAVTVPEELRAANTATAPDKDYETTTPPPRSPEERKLRAKKARFLSKIKKFFSKDPEPEDENPDSLEPQFENIAPVRPPRSANDPRSLTDDLKHEMFLNEETMSKHSGSIIIVGLAVSGSVFMIIIIILLVFLYVFRDMLTWKKSDGENDEEDSLEEQDWSDPEQDAADNTSQSSESSGSSQDSWHSAQDY